MKTKHVMFLIWIVSLILSGCAQQAPQQTNGSKSKELVLAVRGEPDTGFDPTTGWGRYGSPLFQSTLLKYDSDLKPVNDLASDYQISEDGKVWTVKMREDVVFSDEKPLTSEDVVYTFETASTSGSVVDLQVLDHVEALDKHTIKFTLKQSQSTFLYSLISTGIVPKHAHDDTYASHPIGSGPYQFVQWDKGQQLIVKANPFYYDQKPFFEQVTFLFLSEDAAFAAAQAGKVDVVAVPVMFSKQDVKGMHLEAVKSVDNRGIAFPTVKSGEKTEDGLPIGNDVTADPIIRKAINFAVDRQALVQGVLEGHGTPAYTSVDGLPWWNRDSAIKDGDMDTAKKMLEEAGWVDQDGDGIREKGALKAEFTLVYPADDVTRQSLAIATADMLKPLGVHIVVEGKSWDEIQKVMHTHAILFGYGSHDPLEMYNIYSSKYGGVEYYNTGFYHNEKVDSYMDKALAATTTEEANDYWKKAQWDGETGLSAKGDAPWAWLVNLDHLYFIKDDLDVGKQKIQPHGHGWPITDNLVQWKWNE